MESFPPWGFLKWVVPFTGASVYLYSYIYIYILGVGYDGLTSWIRGWLWRSKILGNVPITVDIGIHTSIAFTGPMQTRIAFTGFPNLVSFILYIGFLHRVYIQVHISCRVSILLGGGC